MQQAKLDHIVIAAASLTQGIDWAEEVLGIRVPLGGEHAKMGTHNAVIRLDGERYFEIIAINPSAPAIDWPRWFGLDNPDVRHALAQCPQLLTWAINTSDIRSTCAAYSQCDDSISLTNEAMTRDTLAWNVAFATNGELIDGGLFPLIIEWHTVMHPARAMRDSGCSIVRVEIASRDPDALQNKLTAIGALEILDGGKIRHGEHDVLAVTLQTPKGEVTLSSA